jgi:hypothetical protein
MNANEARKNIENYKKVQSKNAELTEKERNEKEKYYHALGAREFKEHLERIQAGIKGLSLAGKTSYEETITYHNEYYGREYLTGLAEVLVTRLQTDGFKVNSSIRYESSNIYEGTMNPEWVGSEYSNHYLNLKIEW